MDPGVDNFEINQDELIIQQQRQIEKEVSIHITLEFYCLYN